MNYLLDTHTLLWSLSKTDAIPEYTLDIIADPGNNIYVSSISLWEIAVKQSVGKLVLSNTSTTDLLNAITTQ